MLSSSFQYGTDDIIVGLCIHIGVYRLSNFQFAITAHHGQMAPAGRKRQHILSYCSG
jgi:hypothetical protein